MTDDEIRLKIAELKGFSAIKPDGHKWYKLYQNGKRYSSNQYATPELAMNDAPDWPTDPRAALELVEEAVAEGYDVEIVTELINGKVLWFVKFTRITTCGASDAEFCRAVALARIARKENNHVQ